MIDYANICEECNKAESHPIHGKWKPQYEGKVDRSDLHNYIRGCYCADSGRCEVCVDRAIDHADYLRKAAKENYDPATY